MRFVEFDDLFLEILGLIRSKFEVLQVVVSHSFRIVIAKLGLDKIGAE